jgi:NADH-quinone oxidoreductase subunit L
MVNQTITQSSIYLIPALPLMAFVINLFFGRWIKRSAGIVSVLASALSCTIAWPIVYRVIQGNIFSDQFTWLLLGNYSLELGYYIDPLSACMLIVVTLIGTLIQIYSIGYMHDDPLFSRFFAYVSLFMFGMLTLVIANNYILFFMAWEIMGLCSYLLIGFYFHKKSAADASKKAFLTTKIGDIGLFLGILTLFTSLGTLSFSELTYAVHAQATNLMLPIATLLIFCGTIGKSAQLPLHVWLPNAMEGPTPVSALIHAATMVAAGVYLVARSFVLLETFPQVMPTIAWVGTLTALIAAIIALTATDIKKVLAYSTISQLGFMVAAMGLGAMIAGMFHLTTHAFFKALLFLAAGSVIHGTGTQDIREMGGLFNKMKHTAWTFLIGSIAIAGIPPLSGFWSKDEILVAAKHGENPLIYILLTLAAFMTAFYMFRLFILTFMGKVRNEKVHAHESPWTMTLPLWILAFGSIFVGILGSPWMHHALQNFLHGNTGHVVDHQLDYGVMISSSLIALAGILLAWLIYRHGIETAKKLAPKWGFLRSLSIEKFWFDEFYVFFLIKPFHFLGRFLFKFDQKILDGIVNSSAKGTNLLGHIHYFIDRYFIDAFVNLIGTLIQIRQRTLETFTNRFCTELHFSSHDYCCCIFIFWD